MNPTGSLKRLALLPRLVACPLVAATVSLQSRSLKACSYSSPRVIANPLGGPQTQRAPFDMKLNLSDLFPRFQRLATQAEPEHVLPGRAADELAQTPTGIPLPTSYKQFLSRHPPLEALTAQQRSVVAARGGCWPPPSDGMLCFAEYFLEADGDQVLFKIDLGLHNDEYPVYYYAHEGPSIRKVADGFAEWLENHCIQDMR